jgi:hypothetical protein
MVKKKHFEYARFCIINIYLYCILNIDAAYGVVPCLTVYFVVILHKRDSLTRFRSMFLVSFDRADIYPNFVELFMILVLRNFDFDFDVEIGISILVFILFVYFWRNLNSDWSKFLCQNWNFDFGFDVEFRISILVLGVKIGISILVSISTSEFRFWFWSWNRNFDADIRAPISLPSMSNIQSIFHWNKSKFLFWLLIRISMSKSKSKFWLISIISTENLVERRN